MMNDSKGTVLITGGSSGIGKALAHVFAKNDYRLILVARNIDALTIVKNEIEDLYRVPCEIMAIDLSEYDSSIRLYDRLKNNNLSIEILVNNAGFGTWGNFSEISVKRSEQEIALNIMSLSLLTNLILKDMVQRGSGKILNIGSTAGFQPGPMMAVYYATKAYVLSFSEALAQEVKYTGVSVTVLCPGPTETGFQQHAGMANMHLLKSILMMDAKTVAETAFAGLMKGKRVLVPGLLNKIVSFVVKFLPREIVLRVVHGLHRRRG